MFLSIEFKRCHWIYREQTQKNWPSIPIVSYLCSIMACLCPGCVLFLSCCVLCVSYLWTTCVLFVSYLCPICVLFVSYLCSICVLLLSCLCPVVSCVCLICVLFVFHLCPICGLFVSYLCPICALFVAYLCHICVLFVSCLCPVFVLFVSCLCSTCALFVSCLCPICVLFVSYLCPICFLFLSYLWPICVLFVTFCVLIMCTLQFFIFCFEEKIYLCFYRIIFFRDYEDTNQDQENDEYFQKQGKEIESLLQTLIFQSDLRYFKLSIFKIKWSKFYIIRLQS